MSNREKDTHASVPPSEWNDLYSGRSSDYEAPDADLLAIAEELQPGRALDVGCGAGGLVLALAERGWEVAGVDIAERAIAAARQVLRDRGAEAELVVADAASWQPPGRYDLITSSFAMPEGAERTATLRMMRDALAPGGLVAVKEFDATMTRHGHFAGFDLVTVEELRGAFAGLEIERAEIVPTPVHEHAGDGFTEDWTAALFRARLPRAR
jgi:trans-aconitate methyltransferase